MTHKERTDLIKKNIHDNSNGEITAKDLRDVEIQISQDLESTDNNVKANTNRIDNLKLHPASGILKSDQDIEVPNQVISNDPVTVKADNRLITVANSFLIEESLKNYTDQKIEDTSNGYKSADKVISDRVTNLESPKSSYTLTGPAPKMIMKVEDGGLGAVMEVVKGPHTVAQMQWFDGSEQFQFDLMDKNTGTVKATWHLRQDGYSYLNNDKVMTSSETERMIREFRYTVIADIADHAKPTEQECKDAFKLIPHYDWNKDDDFYIQDSSGGKIVLIKYRAKSGASETNPGNFFYEILSKAK